MALAERGRLHPLVSTSKTLDNQPPVVWRPLATVKDWAFKHAPLLRIPLCISWAFLVCIMPIFPSFLCF